MIKAMHSIPHFDQMTPKEYQSLFDEGGLIEMTEKYDGSNVSFGVNANDEIYVKSKKGAAVTEEAVYYEMALRYGNDIFDGFGNLLKALKKPGFKELILANKNVQFFCELFCKPQMNVIKYNPHVIGAGTLVVLSILKDGKEVVHLCDGNELINQLSTEFRYANGWNVYDRGIIKLSMADSIRIFAKLTLITNKELNVLMSRKRVGPIAAEKKKLQHSFKQINKEIKNNLLKALENEKSKLGSDRIEGAVLRNTKTNAMAKIVDLERFGKEREKQWAGIGALRRYRVALFDAIYRDVFGDADIFFMEDKMHQKLFDALEVKGSKLDDTNELLKVLFNDADAEVKYPLVEDNIIVDILQTHAEVVNEALKEVDRLDLKALQDTKNAIVAEQNSMHEMIKKSISYDSFYASLIEFILGPRLLRELQDKYVKPLNTDQQS
jgi:hypothetical protein